MVDPIQAAKDFGPIAKTELPEYEAFIEQITRVWANPIVDKVPQRFIINAFSNSKISSKHNYYLGKTQVNLIEALRPEYRFLFFDEIEIDAKRMSAHLIPSDIMMKVFDRVNESWKEMFVQHIDPSYLPRFIDNPNDSIRVTTSERIDPNYLPQMISDKSRRVRQNVAERIDASYLPQMISDKDPGVLSHLSKRIDSKYLPELVDNPNCDYHTAVTIATRIDPGYLVNMIHIEDFGVQLEIAKRIDPEYLYFYERSTDGMVRRVVAERAPVDTIHIFLGDLVETVRATAYARIPEHLVPKKYRQRWNQRTVKAIMEK